MASVFRLYVQFWPLPHDITRFSPMVMVGPPDTSRHLLRSLETLDKDRGHVATASLYLQKYPDQGQRFFDPEIAIEFCDEGMKLVVGRWNGLLQWFVLNPDSTVTGIYEWFHTDALLLLPLEKRLGFRSVMDITRYDCTSIDAVAGHDHYRIHVILSPTQWDADKPYPIEKARYTLHTACGTTLLQDLLLLVSGDKLKDNWGIHMVGVTDNNGWREHIGQTVYLSDTKKLRIRVRDLDWIHQSLVWLVPVKRSNEEQALARASNNGA